LGEKIVKGIKKEHHSILKKLKKKQYFGEVSFVTGFPRTATA
jgi:hypothetical protein